MRNLIALAALTLAACPPAPPAPTPPPTPPPAPTTTTKVEPIAQSAETPATTTVAIIGGGLAGLVTAHELKKQGIAFHLIEMNDVVGGRVQTAYYDGGLHAEYGLQELWASNPMLGVVKDLGVKLDEDAEYAYSSMVFDGKVYPYVQDTADAFFDSFLKPEEKKQLNDWKAKTKELRDAAETVGLKNAEVAKLQDQTFKQWVESLKMSKRVNDWIRMTLECELATPWDRFSAAVGVMEYGYFLGPEGEQNYKVLGGNSKLIEALANEAAPHVTTSATATRVDHKDGKVVVSYIKSDHEHTITADRVVVAVPFWRLHQIHFDPPLSPAKWDAIGSMMRGQYTVVHLIVNKGFHALTDVDGKSPFPVLTDGKLGVIYGVQSEAPKESPNEVFAFLVHGDNAYAFHMVPRDVKIKEVLDGMDALWPGFSKFVVSDYVYTYHPGSIAVWPIGRSPIDAKADAIRAEENGVILVGDWTWSGHSDGAAKSGINAAKTLAAELKKP